jgi:TonB family protein
MKGLSGVAITAAAAGSTIIHFFALALIDTIPVVPKAITTRLKTIEVELSALRIESAVPHAEQEQTVVKQEQEIVKQKEENKKEEKKKEQKQEAKKEVKQEAAKVKVALVDHSREKKKQPQLDEEQKRLAAVKSIEQKVAARKAEGELAGAGTPVVTDAEKNEYSAMVEQRVKQAWVIPDPLAAKELKAVIIIEIDKQGAVTATRFEQSSGNASFDQSAMRSISKAAPFPPPPGQIPIKFGLIFQP